jgi:hypothetical protein
MECELDPVSHPFALYCRAVFRSTLGALDPNRQTELTWSACQQRHTTCVGICVWKGCQYSFSFKLRISVRTLSGRFEEG